MKIKVYTGVLVFFMLLVGCDSFLEEEPISFISANNFYTTAEDAEAAINAAYQPFLFASYYGQQFFAQVDMKAEYADGRGSHAAAGRYELDQRNIDRVDGIWNSIFQSINRCNIVLQRVPDIDMDSALRTRILAEAHFLRALNYFNAVRLWGGVPLLQVPHSNDVPLNYPRASVSEVYDFIIADLEIAESDLGGTTTNSADLVRPTTGSAKAMLADVYLTLGDYALAMSKSDEVISMGYSLEPVLGDVYNVANDTHSEDIFSIRFTTNVAGQGNLLPTWMHANNTPYSFSGFRVLLPNTNTDIISSWEDSDSRKWLNLYNPSTIDSTWLSPSQPFLFKKYIDGNATGPAFHGNDWPVYRLPELMFIYAEADLRENGTLSATSLEYINQIRRRAYGRPVDQPDPSFDLPSADLDNIFDERGKEFMCEGKRWFDMLRFNKVEELVLQAGHNYNPRILLWPIPQAEIDNNDGINSSDQNPGY